MKNQLKNPKTLAAIVIVVIAILGGLVYSFNRTSDQPQKQTATTQNTPADKNKDSSQVEAAATTTPSSDSELPVTTAATSTTVSAPKTSPVKTASTTPAAPAQEVTLPPVTQPEAPVTTPEAPSEDPAADCFIGERVIVPVGGVSCSFTIGTDDGSIALWYIPTLGSTADGTIVTDKIYSPVQVIVESSSLAGPDAPFTASSITFHYKALDTATVGDYNDISDGLVFATRDQDGMPVDHFTLPVTVVAN